MRPMAVVVVDVLSEDGFELTPVEDQHPVETLAADGADEALGKGVGSRGSDRRADGPDPLGAKHFVETGRELGVSVPNQEPDGKRPLGKHHGQISGLLDHPGFDGAGGDSAHVHPSGVHLDEEEHVEAPKRYE